MSITKKDFEAIAKIINKQSTEDLNGTVLSISYYLSEYFKTQNSKFDSNRFLKACGVLENE